VIDPKYQSHILVLDDGKVVTGLLGEESATQLTLTTPQAERLTIDIGNIESRRVDPKSLMPTGLTGELTAQQAADLLAYLSSLGRMPKAALRIEQSDETLTVLDGDKPVLVYNKRSPPAPQGIDKVYERSGFLHPVFSPSGQVVTAAFPADHPHQHGVFSAWVKTKFHGKAVDFWNLAGRTGCVTHERVVSTFQDGQAVGFEVDLLHRVKSEPPVDALRERWKITVQSNGGNYRCFDLESIQQAITDEPLVIEEYHYGGMAVRGPVRWLSDKDSDRKSSDSTAADNARAREPFAFLNSDGQDRLAGNHAHAHWVSMTGNLDGRAVSLTVFDHPSNFRAPQAARLHPTKPYFCFSPCVDGEFTIDRAHPYNARYRFIVTDAAADSAWLESQWKAWSKH
jgi:hypothetical protein